MELTNGCVMENSLLDENQDIHTNDMIDSFDGRPLWQPKVVDYDYPMSWAQYNAIKAYPYGVIKFREFDTEPWETGFILDIKYRPAKGSATFELLPVHPA